MVSKMFNDGPIGQFIAIIAIISFCFFFIIRYYQKRQSATHGKITFFVTTALLFAISGIYTYIRPTTLTTRSIDIISTYIAITFNAFVYKQLFLRPTNSENLIDIDQVFKTIIMTIPLIILNYFQQDNLGLFSDGDPYKPTPLFYITQITHYSCIAYLLYQNKHVLDRAVKNTSDIPIRIRRKTVRLGIIIAIWGICILAIANLILSATIGDILREYINPIYQMNYVFCFLFPAIGLVAHRKFFALLAIPQQKKEEELLLYLLTEIRKIVPIAGKKYEYTNTIPIIVHLIIEINDVMRVIWTNSTNNIVITPEYETNHILDLLRNKMILHSAGSGTMPQWQTDYDNRTHYLMVAKLLKERIRRDDAENHRAGKVTTSTND